VIAEIGAPPAAITPIKANWLPPENIKMLKSIMERRSRPATAARAPNEIP
jgi:hypothetical protein